MGVRVCIVCAVLLCLLVLCSCNTRQSAPTEMEQAITSFLDEALSEKLDAISGDNQLGAIPNSFLDYGTYYCSSEYYSTSFFDGFSEGIPSIALNEDGTCELTVNYMEGVCVIVGEYVVVDDKITVTLTDYGDSIFQKDDGHLASTFIFTIINEDNLVIEKGYYAVKDNDTFIRK